MNTKVLMGLVFVVLSSACIGPGGLQSIFGGGPSQPTTTELPPDIITVENINVLPTPPLSADSDFSLSFEVKNQDDIQDVNNVGVWLFDWGLCSEPSNIAKIGVFVPGFDTPSHTVNFAPLQSEPVEWRFKAPSNQLIGGLPTNCNLRFKTNYSFSAITQIDVGAISDSRLRELQRAGQTPSFSPTQSIGRGPIKISFDFGVPLPVRAATILPVFITVEDKGSGTFSDIPTNGLTIKVPSSFVPVSCDKFAVSNETDPNFPGFTILNNTERIPMIKKKSPAVRCSFNLTEGISLEKTYNLFANMTYAYDLISENSVSIKPTIAR